MGCRARPSGGIDICSHIRFCSDPEPFYWREESSEIAFISFSGLNGDLSLLLINLTAAVMCGCDLRCQVSLFCIVDCWLELERKCTLLHERYVTEQRVEKEEREPESQLSAEVSERLTWVQTCRHKRWLLLLSSLLLMYSKILWLFRKNKHLHKNVNKHKCSSGQTPSFKHLVGRFPWVVEAVLAADASVSMGLQWSFQQRSSVMCGRPQTVLWAK